MRAVGWRRRYARMTGVVQSVSPSALNPTKIASRWFDSPASTRPRPARGAMPTYLGRRFFATAFFAVLFAAFFAVLFAAFAALTVLAGRTGRIGSIGVIGRIGVIGVMAVIGSISVI